MSVRKPEGSTLFPSANVNVQIASSIHWIILPTSVKRDAERKG